MNVPVKISFAYQCLDNVEIPPLNKHAQLSSGTRCRLLIEILILFHSLCNWAEKALERLSGCANSPEYSLAEHCRNQAQVNTIRGGSWLTLFSTKTTQVTISLVFLYWASPRQNLSSGFPTKWDSNQPAQLQRLARKLKFCLQQV